MSQIPLHVVMDGWTRPDPGTMEIDPGSGTVRVWLREGELVIPRGAVTVENLVLITDLARNGTVSASDLLAGISLQDGNTFQVAPGAVTITCA